MVALLLALSFAGLATASLHLGELADAHYAAQRRRFAMMKRGSTLSPILVNSTVDLIVSNIENNYYPVCVETVSVGSGTAEIYRRYVPRALSA